jgi:hypothetical protein
VKRRAARFVLGLSAAMIIATAGACSLIITGDGLVGPGPSDASGSESTTSDAEGDGRACTVDCKGNPCVSGECVAGAFVENEPGVRGVAVDATHVYWTRDDGHVRRRALGGGNIDTLAQGEKAPGYLALEAQHVYWTATGKIRRAKKEAGPAEDVFDASPGPFGIYAADGELCWTEGQGTTGGIIACRGDGGRNTVTIGLNEPGAVTARNNRRFVALGAGTIITFGFAGSPSVFVDDANAAGIFIADPWLYWASPKSGIVVRSHMSESKRETLARDLDKPTGIAADSTAVYWTEPALGRIRKLKL